jgi:hypothetical protein
MVLDLETHFDFSVAAVPNQNGVLIKLSFHPQTAATNVKRKSSRVALPQLRPKGLD